MGALDRRGIGGLFCQQQSRQNAGDPVLPPHPCAAKEDECHPIRVTDDTDNGWPSSV